MRLSVIPALLAAALLLPLSATAAETYYTGNDPGVGSGGLRPNSDAAAAAFDAAAGTTAIIDFESLAPGSLFSSLGIAPGVTVTNNNLDPGSTAIFNSPAFGYNTTLGGSNFLGVANFFGNPGSLDFTFTTPISSFGAYFTDLEQSIGGAVRVQYSNGGSQDIALTKNALPGVQFWGFVDPSASITQITFFQSLSQNDDTRDIWGIDDIRFGGGTPVVPVPAAAWTGLSMLGAMGVFAKLRRRKTAE